MSEPGRLSARAQDGPPDAERDLLRLASISFAILFLELALIRFVSGYIINFGYFTNFILFGAFLGIGLGCLLSRRTTALLRLFPSLLLAVAAVVHFFQVRVLSLPQTRSVVFWAEAPGTDVHQSAAPTYLLVPVLFALTTALFLALATPMGVLFARLPRLKAYTANIVGSLLGIGLFMLCSALWLPPVVWFAVAFLASLPALATTPRSWWPAHGLAIAGTLGLLAFMARDDTWSPYYRQNIRKVDDATYLLAGNGIYGIGIKASSGAGVDHRLYDSPYGELLAPFRDGPANYRRALIIGCGAGNETAYALRHGVERVDAVDINPWVIEMGRRHHPERPFSSPRVVTHVADGRAFLRRSEVKYDLVVYGLPDSTFNLSDRTNLRMESFLFTLEAFRDVRARLTDDGVFVLYNYYRLPWVVQKIQGMLRESFGQQPLVVAFGAPGLPAVLAAGPGLTRLSPKRPPPPVEPTLASDDWPFLYLYDPNVPPHYLVSLGISALVSLLAVAACLGFVRGAVEGDVAERTGYLVAFFFMGAAFLLLETRSVATFGLLFGSTWATNAIVFAAIHVSVLLAILVAARYPDLPRLGIFGVLALSLLVSWAVPLDWMLGEGYTVRAILMSVVAFLPIFAANVLFASYFRGAREGAKSYAFNLLGGMLGGAVEYSSLLFGYRTLVGIAAVFYLLALLAVVRIERPRTAAASLPA